MFLNVTHNKKETSFLHYKMYYNHNNFHIQAPRPNLEKHQNILLSIILYQKHIPLIKYL